MASRFSQYLKSPASARPKRSPSLTSATSTRRERVSNEAASLAAFLTDAGVKPEDQVSIGGFALPVFPQTRRQSNMLVDGSIALSPSLSTGTGAKKGPCTVSKSAISTPTVGASMAIGQEEYLESQAKHNRKQGGDRSPSVTKDAPSTDAPDTVLSIPDHSKDTQKSKRKRNVEDSEEGLA